MRLALIVEYDGTAYSGFQYQRDSPSIQEQLENSIRALTGEAVRVGAAGRTDAGVHALGQVVAFDTSATHPPATVMRAMNHRLPDDIAVKAAYQVPGSFDPRRDALWRLYRYRVATGSVRSPLKRLTTTLVRDRLDLKQMKSGARLFEGVHDFALFGGPLDHSGASTVREVLSGQVSQADDTIVFEVTGTSFLPHQVRRMAGALVDVGRGAISTEQLKQMIDGNESGAVSRSLPPQGLCLVEVKYANFPPLIGD
jgi:tRNA pseudouridine38-40 synthase